MWIKQAPARAIVAAALAAALAGCGGTGIGQGSRLESLAIVKLTGILGPSSHDSFVCFRDTLQLQGTFTDGLVGDFGSRATWRSSNPAVLAVSSSDNLYPVPGDEDPPQFFSAGTLVPLATGDGIVITASYIGLHATFTVNVKKVTKLTVSPAAQTMSPHSIGQLNAVAQVEGYTVDVTTAPEWTFDKPVTSDPDADADGIPDATDKCADTPSNAAVETVDAATLGCPIATIAPAAGAISTGLVPSQTHPVARATFLPVSDTQSCDPTSTVDPVVEQPGQSSVTTALSLTVPASITMEREFGGTSGNLVVGTTDALKVLAHFPDPDSSTQDLSAQVVMQYPAAPTDGSTAPIGPYSVLPYIVKAQAPGTSALTACFDPAPTHNDDNPADDDNTTTGTCTDADPNRLISNPVTLTGVTATLGSIAVAPHDTDMLGLGALPYRAIGSFDSGAFTQDVTRHVTWTTSDSTIAVISNNVVNAGTLFSVTTAGGSVTVTAVSTDSTLTVKPTDTATLCIHPPAADCSP